MYNAVIIRPSSYIISGTQYIVHQDILLMISVRQYQKEKCGSGKIKTLTEKRVEDNGFISVRKNTGTTIIEMYWEIADYS